MSRRLGQKVLFIQRDRFGAAALNFEDVRMGNEIGYNLIVGVQAYRFGF